jgi:hypothetical protein
VSAEGWHYTTRPDWSSAGESMWMRLAKFSLCNRLPLTALAALFVVEGDRAASVGLRRTQRWNLQALATVLEISAGDVLAGFGAGPSRPAPGTAWSRLRYCPACLEAGFHAAWFQWRLVERCPLHRVQLRTGCAGCAAPIPYALGPELASCPLSCARCGCAWVPGLSRPAGRCTPLDRRTGRLFARWGRYVDHVVAEESLRPRHRRGGWPGTGTSPSSAPRPHPLTMVNRVFDVPPPLTAQLLQRRLRQPRNAAPSAPTQAIGPDGQESSYRPRDWPHFGCSFADCERTLRAAGQRLFQGIHEECERGRWRHLLAVDLVAPSDTMGSDTAAALGWTVTWTSCGQTLAPGLVRPTPAFGLAAWLANLPDRPPGTPRRQRHAQMLAWLVEDLEVSAQMWRRVAAFMKSKGVYLLHGALVDLPKLARRHDAP